MKQNSLLFMITLILFGTMLAGQAVVAQTVMESQRERGRGADNVTKRGPTIPVILDGVEYPVGELPGTDGARFYVSTREDQAKGVLRAFSSRDRAAAFMRFEMAKKDGSQQQVMAAASCQHTENYSLFNKDRFGTGSINLLMDRESSTTAIPSRYTHLDFDGWNNRISYVKAACNGMWTTLYSCRNFQLTVDVSCQDPDVFFFQEGSVIPDLVPYGINNSASSLRFCRDGVLPCLEN